MCPRWVPNLAVVASEALEDGRRLSVVLKGILAAPLRLTSVYAPAVCSKRSLWFDSHPNPPLPLGYLEIVGGDFNDIPDWELDRPGVAYRAVDHLWEHVAAAYPGLVDAVRRVRGTARITTFPITNVGGVITGSRIDHFLTSGEVAALATAAYTLPHDRRLTDHSPLALKLRAPAGDASLARLPSSSEQIWRFNTTNLRDPDFADRYILELRQVVLPAEAEFPNPLDWWEWALRHLSQFLHSLLKEADESRRARIRRLARCMREIEAGDVPTDTPGRDWIEAADQLADLNDRRVAALRTRAHLPDLQLFRDVSTSASAEHALRRAQTTIPFVWGPGGAPTTSPHEACTVVADYYAKLYAPAPTYDALSPVVDDLLAYLDVDPASWSPALPLMRRASAAEMALLEQPVTKAEVEASITRKKKGSSPGASGIPYEVFQAAPELWAPSLVRLFNSSWDQGELPPSFTRSLVRLLFKSDKPGADEADMKYYRPVSLHESGYKIFSDVFVMRLNKVLPELLPCTQFGFVAGRRPSEPAAQLACLLDYYKAHPTVSALLLSLDQEKAYDRVAHPWLMAVLTRLGFGPRFLALARMVLGEGRRSLRVIVNGFLTRDVPLMCGVGQGDGLSCPLYLLAFQPFLDALYVRGITAKAVRDLPGSIERPVTTLAFADDSLTIVSDNAAVAALDRLVSDWAVASNGKVNMAKSNQLGLGAASLRRTVRHPTAHEWRAGTVWKWIGYPYTIDGNLDTYWDGLFDKICLARTHGANLGLTLLGCSRFAQSNLLSLLIYSLTVYSPPEAWLIKVDAYIAEFVWSSSDKFRRLAKAKAIQPLNVGGLAIPSVQARAKLSALKRAQAFLGLLGPVPMWAHTVLHVLHADPSRAFRVPLSLPGVPDEYLAGSDWLAELRREARALKVRPPTTLDTQALRLYPPLLLASLLTEPAGTAVFKAHPSVYAAVDHARQDAALRRTLSRLRCRSTKAPVLPNFGLVDQWAPSLLPVGNLELPNQPAPPPPALAPPLPISAHWGGVDIPPDYWRTLWRASTCNEATGIVWRLAHGKVMCGLVRWKVPTWVNNPEHCTRCSSRRQARGAALERDSLAHRYLECEVVREFWDLVSLVIAARTGSPPARISRADLLLASPAFRPTPQGNFRAHIAALACLELYDVHSRDDEARKFYNPYAPRAVRPPGFPPPNTLMQRVSKQLARFRA